MKSKNVQENVNNGTLISHFASAVGGIRTPDSRPGICPRPYWRTKVSQTLCFYTIPDPSPMIPSTVKIWVFLVHCCSACSLCWMPLLDWRSLQGGQNTSRHFSLNYTGWKFRREYSFVCVFWRIVASMVLRHRTLRRHFTWRLMYKDVVVSGLLRRRHSSYHRHVEPPLSCVSDCCVACLELPSNFGQGIQSLPAFRQKLKTTLFAIFLFGRLTVI